MTMRHAGFPTMSDAMSRIVFDCNVFAQALITPDGRSGLCIQLVLEGRLRLFWSDYVLGEIRRIAEKPTPRKLGITREMTEKLIALLFPVAHWIDAPPSVYQHPFDPKDSHYVDLAVSTTSSVIVSSDRHLLNLMKIERAEGAAFLKLFPNIKVYQPWELVDMLGPGEIVRV